MAVEVRMPKLGLTMSEGVLARWLVADGAPVSKGQPIFEIETDKALTEAEAEAGGFLRIVAEAGSTVPVTGLLGYILAPGEAMPGATPAPDAAEPTGRPPTRRLASPAARRRARELNLDIEQIEGSGEDGQVTLADVEAFVAALPEEVGPRPPAIRASPLAKRLAREAGVDLAALRGTGSGGRITQEDVERALSERQPLSTGKPGPEGEWVPLSGVRSVIAERMLASARETAAVTITSTVDATELVNTRAQLNQDLGQRISYNAILIKIVGQALLEYPYINAHRAEGAVRLLPDVHMGLAVDTPRGLLVVVIPNADQKSIPEIAREVEDKAGRAGAGKATPDELTGSTFTITNLGALGVEAFTPIINPPEVAILGIGRIEPAPMAYQGQLALRQRLVLSLTFDHRLVDGAPAARFLQRVRELIEGLGRSALEG